MIVFKRYKSISNTFLLEHTGNTPLTFLNPRIEYLLRTVVWGIYSRDLGVYWHSSTFDGMHRDLYGFRSKS